MLSVLIECGEEPLALSATLAALVPGAVDGLVREVVVLDRGMGDATRRVCDHAGCRVVPAKNLAAAVGSAKAGWLFLLSPGAQPAGGWIEAIAAHVLEAEANGNARAGRLCRPRSAWERLVGQLLPSRWEPVAVIAPRAVIARQATAAQDLSAIARRIRARTLDAPLRFRAGEG